MGTLTANGQVTTMAQTAVATKIHQAFDVHLGFTTQVTFNGEGCIDVFADGQNFSIRQLVDATRVTSMPTASQICGG